MSHPHFVSRSFAVVLVFALLAGSRSTRAALLNVSALDATASAFARGASNPSLTYRATSWNQNAGFDAARVMSPNVVKFNGEYLMLYAGEPHNNHLSIGLATSSNGETFTRYSTAPVLDFGTQPDASPSNWAAYRTSPGAVINDNGLLRMYYYGDDRNLYAIGRIGLATSTDGRTWTPHPDNPIITNTNTVDSAQVAQIGVGLSEVVKLSDTYHMYYTIKGAQGLYHTSSTDGLNFDIDYQNRRLVSDTFQLFAATTHSHNGTDFILATGYNELNQQVFALSTDGINFQVGSTPIQIGANNNVGVYRDLTLRSLMIEDGVLKGWGERNVGNITWSFGNLQSEYATVAEPNWDALFVQTVPEPATISLLILSGTVVALAARRRSC